MEYFLICGWITLCAGKTGAGVGAWVDGSISPPPPPPASAGTPMMSSVAKVVQPTATVSSVPVCGPSKSGSLWINVYLCIVTSTLINLSVCFFLQYSSNLFTSDHQVILLFFKDYTF